MRAAVASWEPALSGVNNKFLASKDLPRDDTSRMRKGGLAKVSVRCLGGQPPLARRTASKGKDCEPDWRHVLNILGVIRGQLHNLVLPAGAATSNSTLALRTIRHPYHFSDRPRESEILELTPYDSSTYDS